MAASDKTRLALLESEVKAMRQEIDSLLRPGPRATAEALYRMREIEREDNTVLRIERQGLVAFLERSVEKLQEISDLLLKRPEPLPLDPLPGRPLLDRLTPEENRILGRFRDELRKGLGTAES